MAGILVAKETFVAEHEGAPVVVHKGVTRVREGHPLALAHADLFEPIDVHYDVEQDVEQATAAPGEKRSTRRPRKPSDRGEDVSEDG